MSTLIDRWFPASPAAQANGRPQLRYFPAFLAQAALLLGAIRFYELESANGLALLLPWIGAALVINYWLPHRFRAAFFTLTTWGLIFFALGGWSGGLLIATVLVMVGTAHLKIPYYGRVALLLLITAALAAMRLQFFYLPRVLVAVPVLGSMLMFRLVLYMHERKHEKPSGVSAWQRLSYFFVPLNLAFPLFPIIDYKTWIRTHYDAPAPEIYQQGFRRILFGILHLLTYRFIYQLLPNPATIADLQDVALYVLLGYLLILRIAGMFWIIIGTLGAFGYHLPPVFDRMFFITSFSEIWRRLNIYWRDFVTKVFYYPIWFALRKKIKQSVLITSLAVFVVTWLLHGWQWFWVTGSFGFKTTDTLYWLTLGVFISINLAIQSRRADLPAQTASRITLFTSAVTILRVFGMYLFMSVMWSLWNSATVHEWLFLVSRAENPAGAGRLLLVVALVFAGCTVLHYVLQLRGGQLKKWQLPTVPRSVSTVLAITSVLLLFQWKPVQALLPRKITALMNSVKQFHLNQHDRENAEQGYYEKLLDNTGDRSPWEMHLTIPPAREGIDVITVPTDNLLQRVLRPNAKAEVGGLYSVSTNRWGMRDRDYAKEKPPGTFRIALMGASYEMGVGVNDDQTFENITEDRLNAQLQQLGLSGVSHIEILNFGAGGYHLPQQVWLCDHKVFDFQPDLVLYFAHSEDPRRLNGFMASLIQNGIPLEYDYLTHVKTASGAKQWMSRDEIRNRLQPYDDSLVRWSLQHMAGACTAHHTPFAIAYLPALGDPPHPGEAAALGKTVASLCGNTNAGDCYVYPNVLSFGHVWDGINKRSLWVTPDDSHPNAEGHRMIADAFYTEISRYLREEISPKPSHP